MSTTQQWKEVKGWEHTSYLALFRDRVADWQAFADALEDPYRRAQHRYIGSGASGKPDPLAITPG